METDVRTTGSEFGEWETSELEEVGDEVVDIVQTWLQTGLGVGLAALGASADALRATGDALGRLAAHIERAGCAPRVRREEPAES